MTRAPNVYWEREIENIKDEYESIIYSLPGVKNKTAMAHAVQKDAIQNAIDAYDINNSDDWSVIFELKTIGSQTFVTITDTGTFGLTGRALLTPEELLKLEKEYKKYKMERWSRFESLGYANPDSQAIGARGQGKFIFIANSNKKEMIYETLRADGVYRVGHWITRGRGAEPLSDPLEGKEARKYLKEKTRGLSPLDKVGSRIIIINPSEELKDSFTPLNNCDLSKYISETWWELLLKEKKIFLNISPLSDEPIIVQPPKLYQQFYQNPEKFRPYRIIKDKEISSKFKGMKVNEFVIANSPDPIPPELQGISVQRSKMKVTFFDIRDGNDYISKEYKKHIFGWIIFNEKAEEELRKKENPTHYGFRKHKGSLAQEIFGPRGWLSKNIGRYAQGELGITPGKERKIVLGRIQTEVLSYLNSLARGFGYNYSVKVGRGLGNGGSRGPTSKVRAQIPPLEFPGPTRRIEFDEELCGIKSRIINDRNTETQIKFEMALEGTSRGERLAGKPKFVFAAFNKIKLPPKYKTDWYGPYSIVFSEKNFMPGKYTLKAKIVGLEEEKGKILHEITRVIYVSVDPPIGRGMFGGFEYHEFEGLNRKLQYRVEEDEEDKRIILVNISHPSYLIADGFNKIVNETKIRVKINPMKSYLLDIGLKALIREDLITEAKSVRDDDKFVKLIEKDNENIHGKTLQYFDGLCQENLFDAYSE